MKKVLKVVGIVAVIIVVWIFLLDPALTYSPLSTRMLTPDGEPSYFVKSIFGDVYARRRGCPPLGCFRPIHSYYTKLDNVSSKDFQSLTKAYGKTSSSIYHYTNKIESRDTTTFEVIDNFVYTRDKNGVYYNDFRVLKDIQNPLSFEKIKKEGLDKYSYLDDWYISEGNVYFNGIQILNADPETFKIYALENGAYKIAADNTNVYDARKIKSGCALDCAADIRVIEFSPEELEFSNSYTVTNVEFENRYSY